MHCNLHARGELGLGWAWVGLGWGWGSIGWGLWEPLCVETCKLGLGGQVETTAGTSGSRAPHARASHPFGEALCIEASMIGLSLGVGWASAGLGLGLGLGWAALI